MTDREILDEVISNTRVLIERSNATIAELWPRRLHDATNTARHRRESLREAIFEIVNLGGAPGPLAARLTEAEEALTRASDEQAVLDRAVARREALAAVGLSLSKLRHLTGDD